MNDKLMHGRKKGEMIIYCSEDKFSWNKNNIKNDKNIMKRFNYITYNFEENKKADNFIKDIIDIFKKHNLSLYYDCDDKNFVITNYDNNYCKQINNATIKFDKQ